MLETRRLLTVNYDGLNDIVNIVGSDSETAADVYQVSKITIGATNAIRVTENGTNYDFLQSGQPIALIVADLLGGNDRFSMDSTITIPATVYGGAGVDTVNTGAGGDNIFGGSENDVVNSFDGNDVIQGEAGRDTLLGGNGRDEIDGGDANDTLEGGNDDDTIFGRNGKDLIYAGAGLDWVDGGAHMDTIFGESDDDTLYGRAGDDFISGGNDSDDRIWGGLGNDELHGDEGDDLIWGGGGKDLIFGETGIDRLSGGQGDDTIFGGDHDDRLLGEGGNDILTGDNGSDIFDGGIGFDTADYSTRTVNLLIDLNNIDDDGAPNEHDNVLSSVERVIGGSGNDIIIGSSIANNLLGRAGVDSIFGRGGNDVIRGGADGDFLFGEEGDDDISGQSGADNLFGGSDEDTLRGGSAADTLHGDDGNDRLLGGDGADLLFGDEGIDSLFGAAGADELTGGADSDRFLDSYTLVLGIRNWSDNHSDKNTEDVRVGFNDGTSPRGTGDDEFAAGSWTEADVEAIDAGLKVLHEATGNKNLLERAPNGIFNGDVVTLTRQGAGLRDGDADGFALAWNELNGKIYIPNAVFSDAKSPGQTIIHEMAHNWHEKKYNDFYAISGWIGSSTSPGPTFVQADAFDAPLGPMFWWFDSTLEGFVTGYAKTNPLDDFAESFTNYFMNLGGLTFVGSFGLGVDINLLPGKTAILDTLLADVM